MSIQHAYSYTNLLRSLGLTTANFTASAAAGANLAHLFDDRMDKVFSFAAGASQSIVVDLGSAQTLECIAVLNSNLCRLAGTPAIEIRASSDNFVTDDTAVKAASSVPGFATYGDTRAKDVVLQFPATTKRYWKVLFTWGASGTLTVGELWFGTLTPLARAIVYGHEATERIKKTSFESHTGEVRSAFVSGPIRGRVLGWKELSTTQGKELMAMWRFTKGGCLSMLWVERFEETATAATEATMECLFGHIVGAEQRLREIDFGLFDPDVVELRSFAREVGA